MSESQKPIDVSPITSSDKNDNVFLNGAGVLTDSVSNLLTFNYLNVANDILKIIYDQMNLIVPSGDEVADAQKMQESILNQINELAKTPEFQQKWRELTRSLAMLLNDFINQVLTVLDEEGEETINKISKVANNTFVNLAATAIDTAQDALSVVPGLDAIIAMFNLFTSAITNGANSMLTALTLFNSMIDLSSKVANTGVQMDSKLVNISNQIQDFIKMLQSPGSGLTQRANEALDKVAAFNAIPGTKPTEVTSRPEPNSEPTTEPTTEPKPEPTTEARSEPTPTLSGAGRHMKSRKSKKTTKSKKHSNSNKSHKKTTRKSRR